MDDDFAKIPIWPGIALLGTVVGFALLLPQLPQSWVVAVGSVGGALVLILGIVQRQYLAHLVKKAPLEKRGVIAVGLGLLGAALFWHFGASLLISKPSDFLRDWIPIGVAAVGIVLAFWDVLSPPRVDHFD